MQVFDQEIYDIVEKGLEGNGLSAEDVLALYEVEETSKEAGYIRWAGQHHPAPREPGRRLLSSRRGRS